MDHDGNWDSSVVLTARNDESKPSAFCVQGEPKVDWVTVLKSDQLGDFGEDK